MKSARNQLILLGFICQALTWDDYLLPLVSIILWVSCLTVLQGRIRFSVNVECLLMVAGTFAALGLGYALSHNIQFCIGHGFTVIQMARLLRPLSRREKIFSIILACFQLGVGCTFLFDLRFIPVFIGMVILLPKTFAELEAENFATAAVPRISFSLKPVVIIFLFAALFFTVFPRGLFGRVMPQISGAGPQQNSASLLDDVVDPTRSGSVQSRRVVLQLQGEKIRLLRCYCLSDFDGTRWTSTPFQQISKIATPSPEASRRSLARTVHVKQTSYLGRVLPTDGRVIGLTGKFFRNPVLNAQDNIQCETLWNSANNTYEYKIDPQPDPTPLDPQLVRRMTSLPPQSARLHEWLNTLVADETNQLKIARRLEAYLHDNFKYTLGAPELRRLDPVDDFIFDQKQGHCERFASTLAVLLRLRDIPARVVIGYMPRHRGGADNTATVRFSDAHAWTEAWFENTGWLTFDATPAATTDDDSSAWRDWFDTVDLAWNLHVVNFDGASQRILFNVSLQGAGSLITWAKENIFIPLAVVAAALLVLLWRIFHFRITKTMDHPPRHAQILATHYYGQMLRALARQGFHRAPQQTPIEFLQQLTSSPFVADAQLITQTFNETRYGHQQLSPTRQAEIQQALTRIKKPKK